MKFEKENIHSPHPYLCTFLFTLLSIPNLTSLFLCLLLCYFVFFFHLFLLFTPYFPFHPLHTVSFSTLYTLSHPFLSTSHAYILSLLYNIAPNHLKHTHTQKQTLSYILHSTSCFIFNHTNGSSESFTLYVTYTYLTLTSCSNHVFCLFCGGCKYNRNITLRGTMCQHLEAGIGMIIFHSHSALKQQDKVVFFTIVTTLKLKIKISMLLVICMIIMLLLLL